MVKYYFDVLVLHTGLGAATMSTQTSSEILDDNPGATECKDKCMRWLVNSDASRKPAALAHAW